MDQSGIYQHCQVQLLQLMHFGLVVKNVTTVYQYRLADALKAFFAAMIKCRKACADVGNAIGVIFYKFQASGTLSIIFELNRLEKFIKLSKSFQKL